MALPTTAKKEESAPRVHRIAGLLKTAKPRPKRSAADFALLAWLAQAGIADGALQAALEAIRACGVANPRDVAKLTDQVLPPAPATLGRLVFPCGTPQSAGAVASETLRGWAVCSVAFP